MLDKRLILENPQLVQENCDRRGAKVDVARFVEVESQRRKLQAEVEELSRQANVVSKSIGQAKSDAERNERKDGSASSRTRSPPISSAWLPKPMRSTTRCPT
jgi:seryl-tRNA synthetase